ncbi:MAG: Trk system potassium transporter TrkA, partial [Oscillospiraceae bacterium]|nr:Trk system potassium transporter TrkA [Oscillospiraceae bacterium]
GAKHTIARIRNPEYRDRALGFMRQELGLSMTINPDKLAARELFNILKLPSAAKVERFSGKRFELIEIKLKSDSLLDGVEMASLRQTCNARVLVCMVQRDGVVYIPDGKFKLKSGDRIALAAKSSEMQLFMRSMNLQHKSAKNIMILGGSRISIYLAEMLCATGSSVTIIERDLSTCEMLASLLPKATIINGDGSQQDVLLEEGLSGTDAFVSLTNLDEENILMSVFASNKNVPKVIAKVNTDSMYDMAQTLGLDSVISPKYLVSDSVVSYARALENSMGSSVESLYNLMDGKAEALEFSVSADSKMLGVPLKDLSFKRNVLLAAIFRGRETIIPSGGDMIMAGDKVLVVTTNRKLQDLSDILR